ncbi:MAG: SdiA-regulated domain-containing protein [Bacteroidia bacterium]|nr:SdiA-regulated domain-containing protein [Bacteroidia bacterium]NNC85661.1 hypothetical protein [Bacteroidia bacterium]
MKDSFAFLFLVAFIILNCHPKPGDEAHFQENPSLELLIPYNLSAPDQTWWLPHELQEISGITPIFKDKIACVQDEKGIVYIYNTKTEAIEDEYRFSRNGDYEDLHYEDGHFHVLMSNGKIHEFDYIDSSFISEPIKTGLKNLDFEGLCLSNERNKFLLAPKLQNNLFVYNTEQNMIVDSIQIKNFNADKLKASAIVVDTISNHIYVLSSPNKNLLILDYDYTLVQTIEIDSKVFKQPEGMFISKEGDLYISNEGKKGKANILRFKRQNEKDN